MMVLLVSTSMSASPVSLCVPGRSVAVPRPVPGHHVVTSLPAVAQQRGPGRPAVASRSVDWRPGVPAVGAGGLEHLLGGHQHREVPPHPDASGVERLGRRPAHPSTGPRRPRRRARWSRPAAGSSAPLFAGRRPRRVRCPLTRAGAGAPSATREDDPDVAARGAPDLLDHGERAAGGGQAGFGPAPGTTAPSRAALNAPAHAGLRNRAMAPPGPVVSWSPHRAATVSPGVGSSGRRPWPGPPPGRASVLGG